EELEELAIRLTMEELEGDVTAALKVLGTSRATLYRKLKKYGIETA
ncbi:MAG: Fis family transcriptional regulator, partial [Myxococcales bacterium]|nr:Fis family transcriptional regulator [Myxococcales bacterium]